MSLSEITPNFRAGMLHLCPQQKWCGLLLCFLWQATVSAWIYGQVVGFCSRPRLALLRRMERHSALPVLSHSQSHPLALPTSAGGARAGTEHQWGSRSAGHSQECCGFPSDCPGLRAQLPPQLSSQQWQLLLFWQWRASAQHVLLLQAAQVMSLPQGRAQAPALLLSTGTPSCSSCQPLPPPAGLQSLRGFHQLKYFAYKQKMFLFPTAEPCSSLSSKHSHTCASWWNSVIWAVKWI